MFGVERQAWRYFDWLLLLTVLLLCAIGIVMIYSASHTDSGIEDSWLRQFRFTLLGIVILVVAALFDYRNLELLAPPGFILFVASLIVVFLFGKEQGGSTRWIEIGGTLVQPTESGKFLMVIFMAWYLSWFQDRIQRWTYLLGALFFLLAPLALVYLQPDLGMTVTYAFIGGMLILVAGIRLWHLAIMVGVGLVALPFFQRTLQDYMVERINMFLTPEAYSAANFNVEQALIAIGSGDWWGQGYLMGSQSQGRFLRVRHTDFIFSVIAEEIGLIGSVIVLVLLFIVIWRLLRIADLAQDQFGRLIATGVAAVVFFQVAINVGMNLSLTPVTGLTLPFISYGGSSLLSMMFAIGMAQSVVMRHKKIEFQ